MLSDGNDLRAQQAQFVRSGDSAVRYSYYSLKAQVEAGADPNGIPGRSYTPLMAATIADDAAAVEFLLEKGADPDRAVTVDVPCPIGILDNKPIALAGERALHLAARFGQVDIVRLLLKRAHADANATDNRGCTPLLSAFIYEHIYYVEVVRLLLEAGADPSLADEEQRAIPLHLAALSGDMDLVDMLYTAAPATLNRCTTDGYTPLFFACARDHESMVSKLLSLGAMQPRPPNKNTCPLAIAASEGFVGVVRVLINEGGIRRVGGEEALSEAIFTAVDFRQAKVLRLLLTADGEERRSEWANSSVRGKLLLHLSAGCSFPAAVSVLLEAGADEAARDAEGCIPRDVIGVAIELDEGVQMDRRGEVAIRRMLECGPAYRARSWAWPSDEEADAGGSGGGDTGAAGAAVAAVLSSPPATKNPPAIGARVFRPREKNTSSSS